MAFMKTNSVYITVDGFTYNSLDDFGLAIENTDYIGHPVQPTDNIVYVAGRSGYLDLTETVFGRQWFLYRPIIIRFGGIRTTAEWDSVISEFRNLFEGKICKIMFANDYDWYWQGRVSITGFEHHRQLGTFVFRMEEADPFKHHDNKRTFTSPKTIVCQNRRQAVSPTITTNANIHVVYGDVNVSLTAGTHTVTDIVFEEGANELTFTGSATVTIEWIEGSL